MKKINDCIRGKKTQKFHKKLRTQSNKTIDFF